jgi:predicted CoA-binding protein
LNKQSIQDKVTVVVGASPNPNRYSYSAVRKLKEKGHTPIPVGRRAGKVLDLNIHTDYPVIKNVDTLTLYLSASNQRELYDYFFALAPRRIIFNPGAENPELKQMAKERGITAINACSLVLLATGEY